MTRLNFLAILTCFIGMEGGLSQTTEMITLEVPQEVRIAIGESSEIRIDVTIKEGYHVQANPVRDEFLIPATIETKFVKEIIPGNPIYPPSKLLTLKGASDTLLVYDGMFSIRLPIEVPLNAQAAKSKLEGSLYYQACDSIRCFAPRSISFTIPIKVVKK